MLMAHTLVVFGVTTIAADLAAIELEMTLMIAELTKIDIQYHRCLVVAVRSLFALVLEDTDSSAVVVDCHWFASDKYEMLYRCKPEWYFPAIAVKKTTRS
jgi:hypothetical protein